MLRERDKHITCCNVPRDAIPTEWKRFNIYTWYMVQYGPGLGGGGGGEPYKGVRSRHI